MKGPSHAVVNQGLFYRPSSMYQAPQARRILENQVYFLDLPYSSFVRTQCQRLHN